MVEHSFGSGGAIFLIFCAIINFLIGVWFFHELPNKIRHSGWLNIRSIGYLFGTILFLAGGIFLGAVAAYDECTYEKFVVDSKSERIVITREHWLRDENIQVQFDELQYVEFWCNLALRKEYKGIVKVIKIDGSELIVSKDEGLPIYKQWRLANLISDASQKELQIKGNKRCLEYHHIPR